MSFWRRAARALGEAAENIVAEIPKVRIKTIGFKIGPLETEIGLPDESGPEGGEPQPEDPDQHKD